MRPRNRHAIPAGSRGATDPAPARTDLPGTGRREGQRVPPLRQPHRPDARADGGTPHALREAATARPPLLGPRAHAQQRLLAFLDVLSRNAGLLAALDYALTTQRQAAGHATTPIPSASSGMPASAPSSPRTAPVWTPNCSPTSCSAPAQRNHAAPAPKRRIRPFSPPTCSPGHQPCGPRVHGVSPDPFGPHNA